MDEDLFHVPGVHLQQVLLDPVAELGGDLVGLHGDDVDGVLVGEADVVQVRLVLDRLAQDQRQQRLAVLVFHRHPRADADGADAEVLRRRVDHAVEFMVAGAVAGHVEDLQPHQGRRRSGQLLFGVRRIVCVRGDRPAGLAFFHGLGHLERPQRRGRIVEFQDVQAGGGRWVELDGQRLAAHVFLADRRHGRPHCDGGQNRSRGNAHENCRFRALGHSRFPRPFHLAFISPLCCVRPRRRVSHRRRLRETPSRS